MVKGPEVLQEYIGIPYYYHQSPEKLQSAPALEEGLNCFTLVHLVANNVFGTKLPHGMGPEEIYKDQTFFQTIDPLKDELKPFDIFMFGRTYSDLNRLHPAIYTGERTSSGDLFLVHASFLDGVVCTWELEKFARYKRYKELYTVKRIK